MSDKTAEQAQPVAQVSEVNGKKCVTFYSHEALYNTPLWTKLYATPVPEQAQPAGVTDTELLDWIIDNATTRGGGSGFTLSVFVPHDSECVRTSVAAVLALRGRTA